jgi:hypothetical protein
LEFTNETGIAVGTESNTSQRKIPTGTVFAVRPVRWHYIEPTKNILSGSYQESWTRNLLSEGTAPRVTLTSVKRKRVEPALKP